MRRSVAIAASLTASAAIAAAALAGTADAHSNLHSHDLWGSQSRLTPGSLVISGTVFPRDGVNVRVGQSLPFATGTDSAGNAAPPYATAVADGQYPYVFNNDGADGSFAVNTPIDLWDVSLWGQPLGTVQIPTNEMTTSFSSKSELSINASTNGRDVSFLGYNAASGALDASNSDTPGVRDLTNPDLAGPYYRVAGTVSTDGQMTFTDTNAYSGDNGRAALLNNADDYLYTAGNDNNGSTATAANLVAATGAQTFARSFLPQWDQAPGAPTQLATFDADPITNPKKPDKPGKDMNFRGLTEFDNVVYYTKGSGSNGINTVYFVDTTGNACPSTSSTPGVGLPQVGAPLPTPGVTYTMCVLKGFNTGAAKTDTSHFPFGIWFANADTLYLADEGNGNIGVLNSSEPYLDAQSEPYAGLQKWVFDQATQQWNEAYVLQTGLNLGTPYTVAGYPTGDNAATGLPWAPATDGLRNISGHVNGDGTVTIYATTSTVSGSGDQGADPNKVVAVTDELGEDTLPTSEKFVTVRPATYGVRYGGVAVLPGQSGGHGWFGGFGRHGR